MFSREFQSTCLPFRSLANKSGPPPKASVQVCLDHSAGGRKVNRKDFHLPTGQHSLYGSCLQLSEARDRHGVVRYATPDQYDRATPAVGLRAVADNWQAGRVPQD